MKTFAECYNGFCYHISEHDHDMEMAPPHEAVDITFTIPEPQLGWYWDGHNWFDTNVLDQLVSIDKTVMIADGVDLCTISGLDRQTSISIEGLGDWSVDGITENTFEFTINAPGDYDVVVESFPYKPITFTVTANAS